MARDSLSVLLLDKDGIAAIKKGSVEECGILRTAHVVCHKPTVHSWGRSVRAKEVGLARPSHICFYIVIRVSGDCFM